MQFLYVDESGDTGVDAHWSGPTGADDSEVVNQTKHKTSEMIHRYTCLDNVHQHNAAQKLGS